MINLHNIEASAFRKMDKPFKAIERSGYWVCVDLRNGQLASYPAPKSRAQAEARFMNRCYAARDARLAVKSQ